MDKKPADGKRKPFVRRAATTTPILLVPGYSGRHAVVMINEGPADVYLGESGTPQANWMYLPASQGFTDNYTKEAWWAKTLSGSGTMSGFIVE